MLADLTISLEAAIKNMKKPTDYGFSFHAMRTEDRMTGHEDSRPRKANLV